MVTYRQSGVNIDAGNKLVSIIKKVAPSVGGFSGLYPVKGTNVMLAASSDGVGTKLKLAFLLKKHDTVGIDLVAMNVNDLVCCGARPAFFLDYFSCGKLDIRIAAQVIKGIKKGCDQAGCLLLGGETAEMAGFYKQGEYDLAGFAVGTLRRNEMITGKGVRPGDVVIGLPSSGPHSNGFSLIRRVFSGRDLRRYGRQLLAPTRIYVKDVFSMPLKSVRGMAHITGGGFYENIVRSIPANCGVVIRKNSWKVQDIFRIIRKKGKVSEKEMHRVFNMGIGMAVITAPSAAARCVKAVRGARVIGEVTGGRREVRVI